MPCSGSRQFKLPAVIQIYKGLKVPILPTWVFMLQETKAVRKKKHLQLTQAYQRFMIVHTQSGFFTMLIHSKYSSMISFTNFRVIRRPYKPDFKISINPLFLLLKVSKCPIYLAQIFAGAGCISSTGNIAFLKTGRGYVMDGLKQTCQTHVT